MTTEPTTGDEQVAAALADYGQWLAEERPERRAETPAATAVAAAPGLTGQKRPETRTGVSETLSVAQAVESGRRIAVSMMDRAEAKHRHEYGQPHIREHCETCAEEYWSDCLRPVHYRELADSLDHTHPDAARRIRSYVKDLEDSE